MAKVELKERKDPSKVARIPIKREKESNLDTDYPKIIENWTVKTNIVKRIKEFNSYKIFTEVITPEKALDLLTLNDPGKNRHLKKHKIVEYTSCMVNKEWKERTGDTIKFNKKGMLIDGQHRLWSIWLSKQTIEVNIAVWLDEDSFAYIDMGANRSAADITSINGFQSYDNILAYAIKCIILFETKSRIKSGISSKEVPNYKVNQWQADTKRMERLLKDLEMIKTIWMEYNKSFFTIPQWLAVYYILRTIPNREKDARVFLESFASGISLKATSPIKVARTYFENNMEQFTRYKKRKRTSGNILTLKVKILFAAWNLWLEEASVSSITIDTDSPEIQKPGWNKKRIGA